MSGIPLEAAIQFRVEREASVARVMLPADFDPSQLNETVLEAGARAQRIEITPGVREAFAALIEEFRNEPRAIDRIIAEAQPALDGVDGRLDWKANFDEDEPEAQEACPVAEKQAVDFYNRSAHVSVKAGEHLATMIEPTEGTDGRDVCGGVIRAKPGKKAPCSLGANVLIDAQGRITAEIDGRLIRTRDQIAITSVYQVPGWVDFSTGNIDFTGSVEVKEGVRDRFIVRTTEHLSVGGLIEAATIECGGNFSARMGMAAKDRGDLRVNGNAEIGFLNNVRGLIKGDLIVRREVMNCRFVVGGSILGDAAAVIGGEISVTGSLRVARLGADAGTPTIIHFGGSPLLSIQLRQLKRQEVALVAEVEESEGRYLALRSASVSLSAEKKERLTEMSFEVASLNQRLETTRSRIAEIEEAIERANRGGAGDITISKVIYPQVRLRIAGQELLFERMLKGPVKIGVDEARHPNFRQGNGSIRSLTEVASILRRAA